MSLWTQSDLSVTQLNLAQIKILPKIKNDYFMLPQKEHKINNSCCHFVIVLED